MRSVMPDDYPYKFLILVRDMDDYYLVDSYARYTLAHLRFNWHKLIGSRRHRCIMQSAEHFVTKLKFVKDYKRRPTGIRVSTVSVIGEKPIWYCMRRNDYIDLTAKYGRDEFFGLWGYKVIGGSLTVYLIELMEEANVA